MAALAIALGGLLIASALAWVGVQGLRGIPDATGKQTSRATAIVCLVLAIILAVGALLVPKLLFADL